MPPSANSAVPMSLSWLQVGHWTHHLIATQEGKIFVSSWSSKTRASRRSVIDPLVLLKMVSYFPKHHFGQDILDLMMRAGNAQGFETMTAHELWSAWGDTATEAERCWREGDREGALRMEAKARDYEVRHGRLIWALRQEEVERAAA
jgi:hypothetical protein